MAIYKTISLGGSLIWSEDGINTNYYTRFCEVLGKREDDLRCQITLAPPPQRSTSIVASAPLGDVLPLPAAEAPIRGLELHSQNYWQKFHGNTRREAKGPNR